MLDLKTIRSRQRRTICGALLIGAASAFAATPAFAHFILMAPPSWMSQNSIGAPEKLGPCGDEGGAAATGTVTAMHPGQTVSITVNEVIHHPGHYRVALSVNDRSELPAEPLVTPVGADACGSVAIESPAVFPVLVDNALPHTGTFSGPQTFTVTLPNDVTCDHCTLQVLEYMSSHGAPCFYHHCADISIQPEVVVCGDAQLQTGEQCDDGNVAGGDGCDATCHLECVGAGSSSLSVGKLQTPPGDDTLSLSGSLTLPVPVSPAINPLANGVRLLIADAAGTVLDATVPGGNGWKVNSAGTKWAYKNSNGAATGGITRITILGESAGIPGLVRYSVRGKGASVAIASNQLPVTARLILSTSGGQCGDMSFASCAFNGAGSSLRCE